MVRSNNALGYRGKWTRRLGGMACLLAAATIPQLASAGHPEGPHGSGDLDRGEFEIELYRGVAVPFELSVVATPNNCEGEVDLKIKWDAEDNEVKVKLSSDNNTLEPHPNVDRTFGVDYLPNQFFEEPEDVLDGRYQLWLISAAGPVMNFWYSPATLDLVGGPGEFPDPENPPMGLIPVPFPTLYMFSTPMFQPSDSGKVNMSWEFPYDEAHRGDRPEFSHHIVTFPPPNLCGANPFRLDLSHLRPYITAPLPRSEARPWSDYLRGGLLFDITIEPGEYFMEPPLTSLTATYSGATAVGGSIPRGWQLDIESAFAGLAPPIKRFAGADTCEQYFEGFHDPGINFCGP